MKHTLTILALLLMPLFSLSAQDITFEQVMEKCRENIQSGEFEIWQIDEEKNFKLCDVKFLKDTNEFGYIAHFKLHTGKELFLTHNSVVILDNNKKTVAIQTPRYSRSVESIIENLNGIPEIFVSNLLGLYKTDLQNYYYYRKGKYYFESKGFLKEDIVIFESTLHTQLASGSYSESKLVFDRSTNLLQRIENAFIVPEQTTWSNKLLLNNLKTNHLTSEDILFSAPLYFRYGSIDVSSYVINGAFDVEVITMED